MHGSAEMTSLVNVAIPLSPESAKYRMLTAKYDMKLMGFWTVLQHCQTCILVGCNLLRYITALSKHTCNHN
jgi:hypothetical protein